MIIYGTVVTCDPQQTVFEDGYVLIEARRIVAVGNRCDLPAGISKQIDCIELPQHWILPGLVNGHSHAPMTLLRGAADLTATSAWLKVVQPYERKFTREMIYMGAQAAFLEMIASGVTTVCDMYHSPEMTARAAMETGIRAIIGAHITTPEELVEACDFVNRWNNGGRITAAYAPHATYSVPQDLLREIAQCARNGKVTVMMHLAEELAEREQLAASGYHSYDDFLDATELLGNQLILAHAIHVTGDEQKRLSETPTGFVHCPTSNAKLGVGIAPIELYHQHTIPVALGTDGAASNNHLSILHEMHTGSLLHRVNSYGKHRLEASHFLDMATRQGARAVHLAHAAGSIEVGKWADIIAVRNNQIHQMPGDNIASTLVYATHDADVEAVMIDGKRLKWKGELCVSQDMIQTLLYECTQSSKHIRGMLAKR